MFVTAVCVLFLIKLRWPKKKKKSIYSLIIVNNLSLEPYANLSPFHMQFKRNFIILIIFSSDPY